MKEIALPNREVIFDGNVDKKLRTPVLGVDGFSSEGQDSTSGSCELKTTGGISPFL